MWTIVKRLLTIVLGYCLASLAAGFTIVLLRLIVLIVLIVAAFNVSPPHGVGEVVFWVVGASIVSGMSAALPAVFIIPLAEALRLRSAAFYGAAGAGAGAASAGIVFLMSTRSAATSAADAILTLLLFSIYFALSGLIGGLVYWRIAGRTAGAWHAPSVVDGGAPT